jgi:hypothetical protein
MVECGLPKAETRVRFPSPAPLIITDLHESAGRLQKTPRLFISVLRQTPYRGATPRCWTLLDRLVTQVTPSNSSTAVYSGRVRPDTGASPSRYLFSTMLPQAWDNDRLTDAVVENAAREDAAFAPEHWRRNSSPGIKQLNADQGRSGSDTLPRPTDDFPSRCNGSGS